VDEANSWMNDKKKTYWRVWKLNGGGYAWCLFFKEDIYDSGHFGSEGSEQQCKNEIRWVISSHIKKKNLI